MRNDVLITEAAKILFALRGGYQTAETISSKTELPNSLVWEWLDLLQWVGLVRSKTERQNASVVLLWDLYDERDGIGERKETPASGSRYKKRITLFLVYILRLPRTITQIDERKVASQKSTREYISILLGARIIRHGTEMENKRYSRRGKVWVSQLFVPDESLASVTPYEPPKPPKKETKGDMPDQKSISEWNVGVVNSSVFDQISHSWARMSKGD